MRVAVIDHPEQADGLARQLMKMRHEVASIHCRADALVGVAAFRPEMVLLGLNLPDGSGLMLIPGLVALNKWPLIVCARPKYQLDRVLSLKLGADSVEDRPIDMEMLGARMEAVQRRFTKHLPPRKPSLPSLKVGQLEYWPHARRFLSGSTTLYLTPTQARLLAFFMEKPDHLLSRDEITMDLWGMSNKAMGHALDVHVNRLRSKLRDAAVEWPRIEAVRNRGFKFRTGGVAAEQQADR